MHRVSRCRATPGLAATRACSAATMRHHMLVGEGCVGLPAALVKVCRQGRSRSKRE